MQPARLFAEWVDQSDVFSAWRSFFSVVCFAAAWTKHSVDTINASGEVFLSHTKLDGRYVLRLAIGNLKTTERHVARAWELLNSAAR